MAYPKYKTSTSYNFLSKICDMKLLSKNVQDYYDVPYTHRN